MRWLRRCDRGGASRKKENDLRRVVVIVVVRDHVALVVDGRGSLRVCDPGSHFRLGASRLAHNGQE